MVPASPGSAELPEHALESEWTILLARRLRAASTIAFVTLATFGLVDLLGMRASPAASVPVKVAQFAIVLVTLRALRGVTTWRRTADLALLFLIGLMVTANLAAVARADLRSLAILTAIVPVLAATLVPWGLARQLVLCAVMLGIYVVATVVVSGVAIFPYPGLAVVVGQATSIYVAVEVARHALARLHAEAALRESEARFRHLAEEAPVMIWMTDQADRSIYLNARWTTFLGACAPQTVGERFRDHLHPDDRAHVLQVLTDALRRRTQWEVEVRLRNQAGAYRWLLIRGEPRTHRGGATAGYIGTATDVTERRLEAESLATARNAAVDAARLKSDFLATMSHEIRTPMHGIFGMTELALDTPDDSERREFMLRARACAKTLMTLLDEILDFSRLEAGRAELLVEPFEIAEIVFDAVNTVSVTAARKGLELVVDCHPDLPERLLGDAARIRQILTNLLANAVKFTAAGEVVLTVDALARDGEDGGGGIRCAVRDTGIGLEAHQVESIFDAFTQGDKAVSREYGGTGLGLAITHRLVTLMGGRVAVESTPGRGSTFEVRLPLPAAEVETAPGEPRIAALHRTRVLVVTDNATCRRVVASTLAREGAEIVDAPGNAWNLAPPPTSTGIDVVIIDTDKSGTLGIEIARRLRARPGRATLPVVFLAPLEAPAQAPADLQPVHVVRKPFRSHDLVRALIKSLHGAPAGTLAPRATAG
jgi:PAS domain S-box-containing protein